MKPTFSISLSKITSDIQKISINNNKIVSESLINDVSNEIFDLHNSINNLLKHKYKIKKIRTTGFVINDFLFFTDYTTSISHYKAGDILVKNTINTNREYRIHISYEQNDFHKLMFSENDSIFFNKDNENGFISTFVRPYLINNLTHMVLSNEQTLNDNVIFIKSLQPFLRYLNKNMDNINSLFEENKYYSIKELISILILEDTLDFANHTLLKDDNDIYLKLKNVIEHIKNKKKLKRACHKSFL